MLRAADDFPAIRARMEELHRECEGTPTAESEWLRKEVEKYSILNAQATAFRDQQQWLLQQTQNIQEMFDEALLTCYDCTAAFHFR